MATVVLRAHFDGSRIVLDEPFELEPNTELIVMVLSKSVPDDERDAWLGLSEERLRNAYGEDEPEYPLSLIKEANPEYATILRSS